MSNDLLISEHDSQWQQLFAGLKAELAEILGSLAAAIEHVGSTAVPGLAAKPIIDLDILLAHANDLPETIQRLSTMGYRHQGDLGIAGREAFRTPPDRFAHHLYVCLPACAEFRRHLLLRDYLRSHPEEAAAYGKLKWTLLAELGNNRTAYIQGKDRFLKDLIHRAEAAHS